MAIGERSPVALIDAPASGRMAVAEAITNLAAARIRELGEVKLSANWMAAAGQPGEDAALYDTVRAVAIDLCIPLGLSIPVGKDSLSMRTTWRDGQADRAVTSPVSLIVSAFAPVADARACLTPLLDLDGGDTVLVQLDLAAGRRRLGASALAQVHGQLGDECPDLDVPSRLAAFFALVQALHGEGRLLAYHDISDGGIFVTLAEMAFASRCGLDVDLDGGSSGAGSLAALFAEELGAVVQVAAADAAEVVARASHAGIAARVIGKPVRGGDRVIIRHAGARVLDESRVDLHRAWSATTHAMQRLRDNPQAADQEFARILDRDDPGLAPRLSFDTGEDPAAPFVGGRRPAAGGDRPRAGRQRPGRDGGGVHARRLRCLRRPHERPGGRPPLAGRVSRLSSPAADFPMATCWARAKAGRSRSCSTRGCATPSPASSRAPTRSRWGSATVAR